MRYKYFVFLSCTRKVSLDNTWMSQRKNRARFHLSALDFYLCQMCTHYYFSNTFFSLSKSSCHFVCMVPLNHNWCLVYLVTYLRNLTQKYREIHLNTASWRESPSQKCYCLQQILQPIKIHETEKLARVTSCHVNFTMFKAQIHSLRSVNSTPETGASTIILANLKFRDSSKRFQSDGRPVT